MSLIAATRAWWAQLWHLSLGLCGLHVLGGTEPLPSWTHRAHFINSPSEDRALRLTSWQLPSGGTILFFNMQWPPYTNPTPSKQKPCVRCTTLQPSSHTPPACPTFTQVKAGGKAVRSLWESLGRMLRLEEGFDLLPTPHSTPALKREGTQFLQVKIILIL